MSFLEVFCIARLSCADLISSSKHEHLGAVFTFAAARSRMEE